MPEARNGSRKWQRHEAKYLISAAQAVELGRYCAHRLPPDPYASRNGVVEYPVLSMYFDSPSRELLRHTLAKQERRYKMRVRTYRRHDEAPEALPAFFEIKRKSNGTVHKSRARVGAALAERLLRDEHTLLDASADVDAAVRMNLSEFQALRNRIHARPVVGTWYMREAYEAMSAERVRITIDRDLHAGIPAPPESGERDMWRPADPGGIILEVKFTNTYPFWVADMLRRFEVARRGVCKYVVCTRTVGAAAGR